ncbi:Ger(x)C family spore germination protein [Alteribacter populi]|uniref:Ger(x)C family spore germination protein n=1 Tax=Alteribacter populi TaxID=2011011 RepID=UPI000BBB3CC1|nr:Ger(x)C family spore germination protein [Alteribacter populi]
MKRIVRTLSLLSFTFLLFGCWDRTEIEEIGFVMGVAFDPVENEEQMKAQIEQEIGESLPNEHHMRLFRASHQIAIPDLLAETGNDGGAGGGQPYHNVVSTNMTNMDAGRRAAAKMSRSFNYEHLKVVVINEELARQGMLVHLIDFYIRDHEMRRRTHVFISADEAKSVLEKPIPLEDVPSLFIERLTENDPRVLQMARNREIGEISERLIGKRSYIIPRITTGKNDGDYVLTGAAVIRGTDNKMIGWLGENDIKGYNWVVGEAENGVLNVKVDREELGEESYIVFETDEMDTVVDYKRKDGQDTFNIEIKAEGMLVESWLHGVSIDDQETLHLLEAEIEDKIEKQAKDVIEKSQQEFHADVFDFIEQVKYKEYDYWEEIRESWGEQDGPFQQAEVTVNATVKLRHYMLQENLD